MPVLPWKRMRGAVAACAMGLAVCAPAWGATSLDLPIDIDDFSKICTALNPDDWTACGSAMVEPTTSESAARDASAVQIITKN